MRLVAFNAKRDFAFWHRAVAIEIKFGFYLAE